MKHAILGFTRLPASWLTLVLVLCFVPSIASADAVCPAPTCPGFFGGPPFAVPFLAVPESLGQTALPPGVLVVAGDVLVYDDPGMTILGDILRFPDLGTGLAGFVILLSDPGDPNDTGLPPPSGFQANTFSMTEDAGGPTLYTAGPTGQVYNILSDSESVPDVPEPATFSLMVLGGLAGLIRLRRAKLC